MKSKKKLLKKSWLYCIIDKKLVKAKGIFNIALKIKKSTIDIIQLRDKESDKKTVLNDARKLCKLFKNSKIIFIINDYLDIAKIVNSDGIHLGQSDSSIEVARKILGKDKIIGVSCHNLKQAISAQKRGVDYISIGPIFPTSTKPEYKAIGLDSIKEIHRKIKIPFFAIGGINENNIGTIKTYGAKRAAVTQAICQAKNISRTVKNLSRILH